MGWNQRELEHMLPLPIMMRTVRSKHGTKRYMRTDKLRMRHILKESGSRYVHITEFSSF